MTLNATLRPPVTPKPLPLLLSWGTPMINWPEMLRHAEDWADGFWAGATSASLMLIAGTAFVLLVRAV